jgi:predicted RND superfamily exporter protein
MATFLEYQSDFGGANRVLVALKNNKGEIYQKDFMEKLRKVTEEVFFVKGVERSSVTSLFSPTVRYNEVVEDGFRGGNIVAADFAGTPEQLQLVRENLLKSDWVGRIVSNDQTSAMVVATLRRTICRLASGWACRTCEAARVIRAIEKSTGVHHRSPRRG